MAREIQKREKTLPKGNLKRTRIEKAAGVTLMYKNTFIFNNFKTTAFFYSRNIQMEQ